jgi:hypothetical protein
LLVNWLTEMVFGAREGDDAPPQAVPVTDHQLPEAPPAPG